MKDLINKLLNDLSKADWDGMNGKARYAHIDLPEGRLAVSEQNFNGGDGHVKKISSRISWVYCGKKISRSNLEKVVA